MRVGGIEAVQKPNYAVSALPVPLVSLRNKGQAPGPAARRRCKTRSPSGS